MSRAASLIVSDVVSLRLDDKIDEITISVPVFSRFSACFDAISATLSILFSFKGTGCGLGFRGKADGESCPPCSLLCNVFLPTVFFCRLDAVHDSNITIDDSDILFCGSRVFGALFAYLNA